IVDFVASAPDPDGDPLTQNWGGCTFGTDSHGTCSLTDAALSASARRSVAAGLRHGPQAAPPDPIALDPVVGGSAGQPRLGDRMGRSRSGPAGPVQRLVRRLHDHPLPLALYIHLS